MIVTRGNGGYIIDALVKNDGRYGYTRSTYLLTRQYIYYTREEAASAFKEYLKEEKLVEA